MNRLLSKDIVNGELEFKLVTLEDFKEALNILIEEVKVEHDHNMNKPTYTYNELFDKKYSKIDNLQNIWSHLSHLKQIRDSDEIRNLYDEYLPLIENLFFELMFLDERTFQVLKNYLQTDD